jgi:hypothetical protein
MKQQTALDWYIDKINEMTFEAAIHFQLFKEGNEYEQAKEMEKEQMIRFAMKMHEVDCIKTGIDLLLDEAEQYYNETFNQK